MLLTIEIFGLGEFIIVVKIKVINLFKYLGFKRRNLDNLTYTKFNDIVIITMEFY